MGFVGAAESKDALWAEQPVPCCIVAGRLGGSAITVAADQRPREPDGMSKGTIFGLGLGPGEPDLMSVRADRLLRRGAARRLFPQGGQAGTGAADRGRDDPGAMPLNSRWNTR